MKYLNQFFDFTRFVEGKELYVVEVQPWKDAETGVLKGTKVTAVILKDSTDYGDGKTGTNLYEKLFIKVRKQISLAPDTRIVPVEPQCNVWGKFSENLSVTCDDIHIVEPTKGQKQ